MLVLTALVLLAHALFLQTTSAQWGAEKNDRSKEQAFVTRSIENKPPTPEPPQAALSSASLEPTQAPTPVTPAPQAAEPVAESSAATEASPPPTAETPRTRPAAAEPTASSAPLTIPESMRLNYAMTGRVNGLDYKASAELEWQHDGQTYDLKMVVSAFFLGSRSMTSNGRITAEGLAPTRFLDKSRSERATHFQPAMGKISFSVNTPDAPWQVGAQDRLSVFLQLGSLLAGEPDRYPVGTEVPLYTAGPREADTWLFVVEAEEKLNLPAGEMDTFKLTRKPQRDYDQTVEIWYAPSMGYLPVRSRITQQNGDVVDQQLRSSEKP